MFKLRPSRQLHGARRDLYERHQTMVAWCLRNTRRQGRVFRHPYTLYTHGLLTLSERETKARARRSQPQAVRWKATGSGKRFRLIECLAALARALCKYLAEAHQNTRLVTIIDDGNNSSLVYGCELGTMVISRIRFRICVEIVLSTMVK